MDLEEAPVNNNADSNTRNEDNDKRTMLPKQPDQIRTK